MHIVESLRNPSEHVPAAAGTVNEESHGPRKSRSNSTLRCIRQKPADEAANTRATELRKSLCNPPTRQNQRRSACIDAHQGLCTGMNLASCNVGALPTNAGTAAANAGHTLSSQLQPPCPETKPAHLPRKQRMLRRASTSSVPWFCVQRTTQQEDPFEAPAANDLHDFASPPVSTPEARSQTQVAVCERSTSTYHDLSRAHLSPSHVTHYRAGVAGRRKEQQTADDDVVPASAFSSGLPRKRRTQTMSEASLVFPDINGECT
jgi:hypothetical protein